MCMIDGDYEHFEKLKDTHYKARKEHKCCECGRVIQKGEHYHYESGVCEKRMDVYKTCEHCDVAKCFMMNQCGGYIYGCIEEDLVEHINTPVFGFYAGRLAVGMRRKWKKFKSDELMEARA